MQFIDLAIIHVRSGSGGSGCVSFRKEKYIEFGGPDGGDGGRGGNVIIRTTENLNTLIDYKYKQHYFAKNGRQGMGKNKTGGKGDDIILTVPIGTEVLLENKETLLVDLNEVNQEFLLAEGGNGGWGNQRFKTSTNRAPRNSNPGEESVELTLWLRLKLLADVGLIGMPNVGKSSLLATITNAKPKIGDFAFTTINPNLGLVLHNQVDFVVADIPGLIEGANEGKGVGIQFLGHIERCKALVHVIDSTSNDPLSDYECTLNELRRYKETLTLKFELIVLNKTDLLSKKDLKKTLMLFKEKEIDVLPISTYSRYGIEGFLDELIKIIEKERLETEFTQVGKKWTP